MIANTEALDVQQYAAQYELLRAQVSGTSRDGASGREARQARGIGLALLLHEGMPGWLKAVEPMLRVALASPAADVAMPKTFAHAQHHDITMLLASLVLSTRHLAGLSPSEGGYRPC